MTVGPASQAYFAGQIDDRLQAVAERVEGRPGPLNRFGTCYDSEPTGDLNAILTCCLAGLFTRKMRGQYDNTLSIT